MRVSLLWDLTSDLAGDLAGDLTGDSIDVLIVSFGVMLSASSLSNLGKSGDPALADGVGFLMTPALNPYFCTCSNAFVSSSVKVLTSPMTMD